MPENIQAIVGNVLPFALMIILLYFLMIRPQNKQKKTLADMRDSLAAGDVVTTIGGILGRVVSVKEDEVTIETGADKTKIKIAKWGISTREAKEENA